MPPGPDLYADPNGSAYRRAEQRFGTPLDYVGEKLGHALVCQHALLHAAQAPPPRVAVEGEPPPSEPSAPGASRGAVMAARLSFGYQLTAYLALYNMLASRGSEEDVDRLVAMAPDDFRRWVRFVAREGSVSGG